MYKKFLILIIILFGFIVQISFADSVSFNSSSKDKGGKPIMLTGILTKPEGKGPFPAVVLLTGCAGNDDFNNRDNTWAKRLVSWGYVTLQVDSLKPRNMSNMCSDFVLMKSMSFTRARDAYDAKTFLAELPIVDETRIAVLGWSHGGTTVIEAIFGSFIHLLSNEVTPFKAAIAFYPFCAKPLDQLNSPLIILIGKKDDWTLASICSYLMPSKPTDHEVTLKVYPGAYHNFDWEGKDEVYKSHKLLYDPLAAQDAIIQVKSFFAKYLK